MTLFDTTARIGDSFWTHGRTDGQRTDGRTADGRRQTDGGGRTAEGQTDVEVEIVI